MPKGDRLQLKADTDDGHTPVANLLLEAVAIAPLSGIEKGAVLALWRLTYGWTDGDKRRTEATISQSDWARYLNTNPVYAQRVVCKLVEEMVFNRKDLGKGKGYVYSMNTRVNQWLGGKLISLEITERFSLHPTKKFSLHPTKKLTPPDTKLASPKENPKESLNKATTRDENLSKISQIFEANIGILTPITSELLKDISNRFKSEWFEEAVKEASKSGSRNLNYISAILERWGREGFKAPRKVEARGKTKRIGQPSEVARPFEVMD